jgi:hypothetical protein
MASQQKRGRSFWTPLVLEYEQTSGVTQAAFADGHGVRPESFRKWLYKIRNEHEAQPRGEPIRFVEVEAVPLGRASQVVVEIGDVRVHLDRLPGPVWLAELAGRLGGSPC